jgi:hypothetical protein
MFVFFVRFVAAHSDSRENSRGNKTSRILLAVCFFRSTRTVFLMNEIHGLRNEKGPAG